MVLMIFSKEMFHHYLCLNAIIGQGNTNAGKMKNKLIKTLVLLFVIFEINLVFVLIKVIIRIMVWNLENGMLKISCHDYILLFQGKRQEIKHDIHSLPSQYRKYFGPRFSKRSIINYKKEIRENLMYIRHSKFAKGHNYYKNSFIQYSTAGAKTEGLCQISYCR